MHCDKKKNHISGFWLQYILLHLLHVTMSHTCYIVLKELKCSRSRMHKTLKETEQYDKSIPQWEKENIVTVMTWLVKTLRVPNTQEDLPSPHWTKLFFILLVVEQDEFATGIHPVHKRSPTWRPECRKAPPFFFGKTLWAGSPSPSRLCKPSPP